MLGPIIAGDVLPLDMTTAEFDTRTEEPLPSEGLAPGDDIVKDVTGTGATEDAASAVEEDAAIVIEEDATIVIEEDAAIAIGDEMASGMEEEAGGAIMGLLDCA